MKKAKPYIISLAITFFIAILGGVVTYAGMPKFDSLNKPFLSPPSFLFPVVWTVLYLLMAVGAARIYLKNAPKSSSALLIYAAQLFFNFWWSAIFFGFGAYLFALIWLLILWLLVLLMILAFYKIDKISGLIQIPYLLWLTFAAYLNLGIILIN